MDQTLMEKVIAYLRALKGAEMTPASTAMPLKGGPVPTYNNQGQGQGGFQNARQAIEARNALAAGTG
jgi:hypothetical protein